MIDMNELKIVPAGETLTLRTGAAPRVLDPFDYQGFQYKADSLNAFVTLIKAKATAPDRCVVFYNDGGYHAILDDTVKDREQDVVVYDFKKSVQFGEWAEILEKGEIFGIPAFVRFLQRREPGEVEELDKILFAAQNFKYVTTIDGDFKFDDRNNYVFAVTVNDTGTTVRLPQTMLATVEIYKDSGWKQCVEVELDIHKPKEAGQPPAITLLCPKFARYLEKAKEQQHAELVNRLDGWLVVAGKPSA